jgi:hypothetical protein
MRGEWSLVLLAACSTLQGHSRLRPVGCAVDGAEIVCAGNPFAELVCVNRVNRYADGEGPPLGADSASRACRALGIHYYDDDTVVWLYRAPGFDPDRPDLPFREAKTDVRRADGVRLTRDGSKVRYRTGSLHPLHGEPVYKGHEYDVFAGTLNDD